MKEYYYATKLFIELIYRSEDMNFDSLYVVESLSFHYRFKKITFFTETPMYGLKSNFQKKDKENEISWFAVHGENKKLSATFNSSLYVNSL